MELNKLIHKSAGLDLGNVGAMSGSPACPGIDVLGAALQLFSEICFPG